MREIKFRGKISGATDLFMFNEENQTNYKVGDWIYGFLVIGINKECWIWFVINDKLTCLRVNPKSVGQFAGKKDMHNEDIYENDDCKISGQNVINDIEIKVEFQNAQFMFIDGDNHIPISIFPDEDIELIKEKIKNGK